MTQREPRAAAHAIPAATSIVVAVRDVPVAALIGVLPEEKDRLQPLIVSVEVTIDAADPSALADTIDYRTIVAVAHELAERHTDLIERYAMMLGRRCLALGPVASARVTIAKPQALAHGMASTTVLVERASGGQVLPFVLPRAVDAGTVLRFGFDPGINAEAQQVLAAMLDRFARSLRGVKTAGIVRDTAAGDWVAHLTLDTAAGPRIEQPDTQDAAAIVRAARGDGPWS